jgi:TrmH family RNA methyltransferase
VVALDGTVDLWGPKAVRASAGLVYAVPVARATGDAFVRRIGELDVPLLVADASGEDVSGVRVSSTVALVVGNEGAGVRGELAAVGRRVAVPMRGPAESLNVGIAGSILLYALSRETPLG